MSLITYNDKSNYQVSALANEYKVSANDMNEIKVAINNSTTYSTTELVIGTGENGKPVYRKVIPLGTLTNNGTTIVSSGLDSSIVRMSKVYGTAINTNDYETLPLPFVWGDNSNPTTYIGLFFGGTSSNGNVWCRTNKNNANLYNAEAILEYQKTTD